MALVSSLPIVGVMGSGVRAHEELAVPLGRRLARLGVHLLTGGGSGVMESVSRGFAEVQERTGLVIGVLPFSQPGAGEGGAGAGPGGPENLPGRTGDPPMGSTGVIPSGYPNPWIEIAIRTHLGQDGAEFSSRNHVNVLTSDVVVALPGSVGTASEIALSVRYGRPVVLFGDLDRARSLPAEVAAARTLEQVIAFVREHVGPSRTGDYRGEPGGTGSGTARDSGYADADPTTVAP